MIFSQLVSSIVIADIIAISFETLVSFLTTKKRAIFVQRNTKVEAFSMIVFFIIIYLIIKFRILVISLPNTLNIISTVIGLVILVIATIVHIQARLILGQNWANQNIVYSDHKLITIGPYSRVRHPLFATLIWFLMAVGIIYSSPLTILLTVIIFVPAVYIRSKQEEELLEKKFKEYKEYKQRVPRFFMRV